MKSLTKVLALTLAVLMIASISLVSCTSPAEQGEQNGDTTTTTTQKPDTKEPDKNNEKEDYANLPADIPLIEDDYKEYHESHTVLQITDVDTNASGGHWSDGAKENLIDGMDGLFNEEDDPTKLGASSFAGNPRIFLTCEDSKIVGYAFVTGNDSDVNSDRTPNEWVLYGYQNADDKSKTKNWVKLDVVRDGGVLAEANAGFCYTIDTDKQGTYNYYVFECISSVADPNGFNGFQLNEMYLYGE